MSIEPEFSRTVDISRLPPEGRNESFSATADECAALKERFGVDAFLSLQVDVSVQPWKRGACRVRGTAKAAMTRTCVVSLDQFDTALEVRLDRLFSERALVRVDGKEVVVSVDDDDFGQIVDGEIEVGEMAVEELLLELDPHPRKPGAEFKPQAANDTAEAAKPVRNNPFAVLQQLKDDD